MRGRYSLPEGCPKYSPWGAVDSGRAIAPGIFRVGTPSHGGIYLDPDSNAKVSEPLRGVPFVQTGADGSGWYEEDVCWAIVALTYPEHFDPDSRAIADRTGLAWFTAAYQSVFPERIPRPVPLRSVPPDALFRFADRPQSGPYRSHGGGWYATPGGYDGGPWCSPDALAIVIRGAVQ